MAVNIEAYDQLKEELGKKQVTLVAVSKTKPLEDILELYQLGQRDFGENYVQELADKAAKLPADIRWHFIGHLQTNKVKYIAPFVQLIQGVDSPKLLNEISKQALKCNRIIDCLLQVYIAEEESKFGLDEKELDDLLSRLNELKGVRICGLMGMASFTTDMDKVRKEFQHLRKIFDRYSRISTSTQNFTILSMGMSSDYKVAVEEGSNLVRIGSLLFGERVKLNPDGGSIYE
ncbi:MAG TPA: YggS family pyridoxal phosphate-dependent enzyme [Chitinophagaceae bacterium]|nr:YggS family pyridoxal phosphate-dependent enzyme [Chitinophagaceae bacterium]